MLSLTLNHKSEIRNEFHDSITYRKVVSYMISGIVVDNLNLVIISRFFYVNYLIKKVGQLFLCQQSSKYSSSLCECISIQKKLAIVNISGFTMGRICLAINDFSC